jgi:endonuclease/exonuclease/phosphatase family metal-dependent hydrolase
VGAAEAPERIRAMSWNLWWRFGADWRKRQPAIVSTLDTVRPDVVGLQEVWATGETNQAKWLAERLGMHSVLATPSLPPPPEPPESPDQAGVDVGVAVLSRWPIADVQQHSLPSRPDAPTVALSVVVDHRNGPLHVIACCVEWERDFADVHLSQTRALAGLVTDSALDGPLPVLLTGDLNAPPDTPQIEVLTDVMVDAWVAAGGSTEGGRTLSSANPFAPRGAWQLDHRIDYVMARPGRPGGSVAVEQAVVAGGPRDGVHPSDHYAVVVDFRVPAS